ncbi:DsbA family protein [Marinobacter mobilis]|uniref:DsbA family protein n=1 Tax=Marinobacter mobilis TaxID=488533 RepID=UPI0035C77F5F
MTLKQQLTPLLAQLITSERTEHYRRRLLERFRHLKGEPHQATFYFRVDDPYSVLMAQVLPDFARHFGLTIKPRVMLYLDERMYPATDMLVQLAPRDALPLARLHRLDFPEHWQLPQPGLALSATRCLLKHEQDEHFWALAQALSGALWRHDHDGLRALLRAHGEVPHDQALATLRGRRDRFLRDGHYLTGTIHYQGEWYWSVERLDHLASRLNDLGLGSHDWPMAYGSAKTAKPGSATHALANQPLDLFFSFRSPYSYLALSRTYALADDYGLTLRIRPVLPMVMRGLSVPRAKRLYILKDAAREARLHNIPFGKVCDPLGPGVERCMAIWPFAEQEGRLREWLLSASTGIWSQGVNPATDRGLRRLVEHAGLDWSRARLSLDNDSWRGLAEANRAAMQNAGGWGVPGFVIGDTMVWGQDRFAVIEQSLLDKHESER